VERCLDDDPDERPPIQEVKEIIEPMVVSSLYIIMYIGSRGQNIIPELWLLKIKIPYCRKMLEFQLVN